MKLQLTGWSAARSAPNPSIFPLSISLKLLGIFLRAGSGATGAARQQCRQSRLEWTACRKGWRPDLLFDPYLLLQVLVELRAVPLLDGCG